MKKHLLHVLLIAVTVTLSACTTFYTEQQQRAMREREDQLILREDIHQVKGQTDNLRVEIERLWDELQRDRSRQQTEIAALKSDIDKLQTMIQALEKARAKDRKEIVDTLSASIADIVRKMQAAQAASASAHISEYGIEHTVQPGETLSEIAAAYRVQTKAIIQANQLKNPDRLRVGQKIFIPE